MYVIVNVYAEMWCFVVTCACCIFAEWFTNWVSLCQYAVNLSGGEPQLYWCYMLHWREQMICYETRGQHIQWTFNSLPWRYLDLELTPTEIYDFTWNPRIAIFKSPSCSRHELLTFLKYCYWLLGQKHVRYGEDPHSWINLNTNKNILWF